MSIKRKILSVIASALVGSVALGGVGASAENISTSVTVSPEYQELYDEYMQYDFFNELCEKNPSYVETFLKDVYSRRQAAEPAANGGSGVAHSYVSPIMQQGNTWCGFANMHEVLAALWLDDKITGNSNSTDYEKQQALSNRQRALYLSSPGADPAAYYDTGIVYYMTMILNKDYLSKNLYTYYGSYEFEDIDDFEQKIYNSLKNDRPVILQTQTGSLGYYNGNDYCHYVIIDYIDTTKDTENVEIVDCYAHYNKYGIPDENTFYGYHWVDSQEVYNATLYAIALAS